MFKKKQKKDFKSKRRRGPLKPWMFRKKTCDFCRNKSLVIDYKDIARLQKFTTERGKILPNRISGNCPKHQRQVAAAIKQARFITLMPYIAGYR